jgi:DNA-binding SARP family transcriptional activator/tetratricopeptide (TPR) repeat protein
VTADRAVTMRPKERTVLAALLLRAGEVVSITSLTEALWEDDPPRGARNAIQAHIKQLRQLLGPDAGCIITRAPGYLIQLEPGQLDLDVFTEHRIQAAAAAQAGQWGLASEMLTAALALWQGEPLADVPSAPLRRAEAPRLAETRLEALEARIGADLWMGKHDMLVSELQGLVVAHPFRERLWEHLMLALYRGGRQADALAAYQRARQALRTELGIDPGPGLQRLQTRILSGDPELTLAGHSEPTARRKSTPRQLPADLRDFTGRGREVSVLADLLTSGQAPGTIAIGAITGPGGIGKTTLAVHLAHQVASQFPEGQLFIRLGGAAGRLSAFEILARLLRELGVPEKEIPQSSEERAGLYRTVMAERKLLLVLDDARNSAQIRPLLPGSGSSAVLVTSRASLADLAGAKLAPLRAFDPAESHALFVAIVGADRAAAEPDGTQDILRACDGLPMAVRIAASRLASQPGWSIGQLGQLLTSQQRRLAELSVGDTAVRATFEVSYLALPDSLPSPARIFRLYGSAGLRTLSLPALAALAGVPVADTGQALASLLGVHLLESPEPGRYHAHDLLRLYAAERARSDESAGSRSAAMHRLLTWYLHTLESRIRSLREIRTVVPLEPLAPGVPVPTAVTRERALEWLRAEHANLLKVVDVTAELGMHDICCQLAALMRFYFDWFGGFNEYLAVSTTGLRSAQQAGNKIATGTLLNGMGSAHWRLGDLDAARECFIRSHAVRRDLGDRRSEAISLSNLGLIELDSGLVDSAVDRFTATLGVYRELGDISGEATALHNLATAFQTAGRFEEALAHFQKALASRELHASQYEQAATLHSIGALLITTDRVDEGLGYLRDALKLCEENNLGYGEGMTLASLGDGYLAQGKTAEAQQAWLRAHGVLTGIGATEASGVLDRLNRVT